MRREGLFNLRGRSRPTRELREPAVLEATSTQQMHIWDRTQLPGHMKSLLHSLYVVFSLQ
jgi:putative transposase